MCVVALCGKGGAREEALARSLPNVMLGTSGETETETEMAARQSAPYFLELSWWCRSAVDEYRSTSVFFLGEWRKAL